MGGSRGGAGVDDEEARARARAILDAEEAHLDVEVVDAVLVEHRGGLLAVLPEPDRAEEDLGGVPGDVVAELPLDDAVPARGEDEQLREHRAPREGGRSAGRGPARGARDDARGSECAPTAPDSRGEKAGSFRLLLCVSVRPACAHDFAHPSRRSLMTIENSPFKRRLSSSAARPILGRRSFERLGVTLARATGSSRPGPRVPSSDASAPASAARGSDAPARPLPFARPRPVRRRRHPGRPPALRSR